MKRFGPGLLVTAAFIGPGSIATASAAGANFGFVLLWALLFSPQLSLPQLYWLVSSWLVLPSSVPLMPLSALTCGVLHSLLVIAWAITRALVKQEAQHGQHHKDVS